jgi:hypothetical protein
MGSSYDHLGSRGLSRTDLGPFAHAALSSSVAWVSLYILMTPSSLSLATVAGASAHAQ